MWPKYMKNYHHNQRNANQNHIEIPHFATWNGNHLETADAGQDVEKQEHFYTIGGSINQFNHCGRQCGITKWTKEMNRHFSKQHIKTTNKYKKNAHHH